MPIVGWTALAIFFSSGLYALYGVKPGTASTALNSLSHAGLAAWALIVGVLLIVFYQRLSDATVGTFDLIELRKRNRRYWIMKGAVGVPMATALAWLAAYGALAHVNTRLPGPTSLQQVVIAVPERYVVGWICREIKVRLQGGDEHWVCTTRWGFGDATPANAACAAGDRAEVAARTTVLGKTLELLSVDSPVEAPEGCGEANES